MNEDELDQDLRVEPTPENPGDVGDAKVVRKKREKAESEFDRARNWWRRVFADETGRAEMWKIISAAGFRRFDFAVGPNGFPQPEATWTTFGKKQYGETLFYSWLRLEPDGVLRMLAENDPEFAHLKEGGRK